jgi:hypothetical protein
MADFKCKLNDPLILVLQAGKKVVWHVLHNDFNFIKVSRTQSKKLLPELVK